MTKVCGMRAVVHERQGDLAGRRADGVGLEGRARRCRRTSMASPASLPRRRRRRRCRRRHRRRRGARRGDRGEAERPREVSSMARNVTPRRSTRPTSEYRHRLPTGSGRSMGCPAVDGRAAERLLDPAYLSTSRAWPIEEIRAAAGRAPGGRDRAVLPPPRRAGPPRHRRRRAGPPPRRRAIPATSRRSSSSCPAILGDHLRAPGVGRLPSGLGQGQVDPELEARVDAAATVAGDDLAGPHRRRPRRARQPASASSSARSPDRRHDLFARIDALQAELTRRYRTGEADVESLLR